MFWMNCGTKSSKGLFAGRTQLAGLPFSSKFIEIQVDSLSSQSHADLVGILAVGARIPSGSDSCLSTSLRLLSRVSIRQNGSQITNSLRKGSDELH